LSNRHLQRLVSGRQSVDSLRPATVRLLERIFNTGIAELLGPPDGRSVLESSSEPQLYLDIGLDLSTIGSKVRPGHGPGRLAGKAHALRVAIAVVVRGSDILLVCRRSGEGESAAWQFPAGIVKPGISVATVAFRETLAETGVHCAVVRTLGSRVHPITNVVCDYVLCDYLTGDAENMDVVENVGVAWVRRNELTRFIPAERIYPPVLDALRLTSPFASSAS
jgi:8-oxo-dGTP diphosphatase